MPSQPHLIASNALFVVTAACLWLLGSAAPAHAQTRRVPPVTITACHQILIGDKTSARPLKAIFERTMRNINLLAGSQVVTMRWAQCDGTTAAEFIPIDQSSGTYLVTGSNWVVPLKHGGFVSCSVVAPDYAVALSTVYYLASNPRTRDLARRIATSFASKYPSASCDGNTKVEVLWRAYYAKVTAR